MMGLESSVNSAGYKSNRSLESADATVRCWSDFHAKGRQPLNAASAVHSGRGEEPSLAAVNGPALTGWADALPYAPGLAGVARAGSESRATKVVGSVSLASPVSPVGGNALC